MTSPEDPFAAPGDQPPQTPPGYGAPPPPPPGYGQVPPAMPYGAPAPQLASWGQRVGGALIDALITFAIYIPFFIIGAVVGDAIGGLMVVLGYLAGFGFAIWNVMQQASTGQTIGKKQVGIKLVREADGQFVSAGLAVGRYFLHFIDSLPCIPLGYLWPLWDAKKQTFADKILATLVIKA